MVTFEMASMSEYKVLVDGKHFGYVTERGFFTDSTVITQFTEVTATDLQNIAEKIIQVISIKIDSTIMLNTPTR